MNNSEYIVVIGAANTDIGGTPYKPLISGDSNPGCVKISYGGVARNIAHNLALLGIKVKLVTAVGDDTLGRDMIDHCEKTGIDTSFSIIVKGENSSVYIFINDESGEMKLALSHVDIVNKITPEYIESISEVINSAAVVVADCNLSKETLNRLKEICEVPLYVDTVSVSHADKIKGNLKGIDTLKPNLLEAEYLTDMIISDEKDCLEAARSMIDQGLNRVFISMGSHGILAVDKKHALLAEKYPTEVKSTTGAGDSAMAAIIWSSLNEEFKSLKFSSICANTAAAATISVDSTINPEMSSSLIEKMLDDYKLKVSEIKSE